MKSLGDEASHFVGQVQEGIAKSERARQCFRQIDTTITDVSEIVSMVDRQADEIAQSTSSVQMNTGKVCESLFSFISDVDANVDQLSGALDRINNLELITNEMFDSVVHSGLSPKDNEFVDIAKASMRKIHDLVTAALDKGDLSKEALFDRNYREIPGSNPVRYNNDFNAFADRYIRPVLDSIKASNGFITSSICSNEDGYLPTHISERSREPTGDFGHDSEFCRNRRIVMDNVTAKAIGQKDREYIAAAYRFMASDGKDFQVVKNIFIPLHFNGRYWGNFELAFMV